MCKLVEFECDKCTIGRRQDNNSCAHDFSLFGYVAGLIKDNNRSGLIEHILTVKKMILFENYRWNISSRKLEESSDVLTGDKS